jgi:hypothetical protein
MTPQQLATRRKPSYVESPLGFLVAIGVSLTLAVLCLGVGFSRPLHRVVPKSAYVQSGHFTYSAAAISPTPVYPSGFATTGQPIYPSLVSTVMMKFRYQFLSKLPHHVHGTVEFRAFLLSGSDAWQEVSTIHPVSRFTGDQTSVTSALPLTELYSLISNVTTQANVASSTYTADLQPVVHVTGAVGGKAINQTFMPVLPFAVTQNVITLAVTTPVAPPGATYALPTAASETLSSLNPVKAGSIPAEVANVTSIAKYQVSIPALRLLGVLLVGATLVLLGLNEITRRRHTRRSDEELIAARLRVLLVPVVSHADPQGRTLVVIAQFTHLASLAQFLERPILYERAGDQRTYVVDDELQRYVYHPSEPGDTDDNDREDPADQGKHFVHVPGTARQSRHARRSTLVKGATSVAILALAVTLVTSFTASNTVSASYVGTLVQPRLISQLAPVGCASLNLTSLVQASGTVANAVPNVLLLGSAGSDTITDTGGGTCIVPGAGTDKVTGTATDICITGPTLNVAAPCPTVNPSNGVTVTPTSSNYNNYGGQETLSLTNTSAITAMTIVIRVALTSGITFNSQANSYPGGYLIQSSASGGGYLTYTFTLSGQAVPAGYPNGTVYAQYGGNGAPHPQSGDTWSVTSTSKGTTSTLTGTF